MESTSGRPSSPEGRGGSSSAAAAEADRPVVLISPGDALAAEIIGAIKKGDVQRMKKIDKKLKKKQDSSLLKAVAAGGQDVADKLLHLAARSLQYEACKFLIKDLLMDVNRAGSHDGFSALHAAVVKGSFEIANLLLTNGAEVNTTCQNERNVALVNLLLERGVDPNAINTSGFTALHVAVIKDSHAIAELLLKNNAQVDAICENGTPLLIASETRASATVVELLIKNGADANKTNTTGCTGLHLAALKDSYAVAQVLLANKADVDVVCEKGTPLHIAAGRGNLNLIRLLLQHEANPDISDTVGRKAIEVAAINGFKDSVVILFPLTSPINEYENWSIDVIMRDAKNQRHG